MRHKGLRNNVTAVVTDSELAAFKKFQQQHGGSIGSIAREAVVQFLTANGYQPTDTKKAS